MWNEMRHTELNNFVYIQLFTLALASEDDVFTGDYSSSLGTGTFVDLPLTSVSPE
jgi:hypothetical protein